MMRVVILGASGFVGRALTRLLRQKEGVEVVAGIRRLPPGIDTKDGVQYLPFEGTDCASVNNALRGATHVVNCILGSANDMISATYNICDAASKTGNIHMIHFSSVAVYGEASGNLDENAPFGDGEDWYGAAKIKCENIVQDFVRRGLMVTTFRPSCIYGPGSVSWTLRIGRLLKARRLGDLGPKGDGRCNLVYIDDVAAAVWAAMTQIKINGNTIFNLSNEAPPTWNEYLMQFGHAIGATPIRRLPDWQIMLDRKLLTRPLQVMHNLANRLKRPDDWIPIPISWLMGNFERDVVYDSGKAARTLTYQATPYEEGLAKSAKWFTEREPFLLAFRSRTPLTGGK
jgi:nucleoside-diphosphate-sugar epimerase